MSQPIATTLDEELSRRFKSFRLTEDELGEIDLDPDDIKASEEECRTSLFGKIISQKPVNLGGLKTTMGLVWGNPKNFRVIEIGKGIYQFIFPTETDTIRILNGKPWFFNNHFLILEKWNPKVQPVQYCFDYTPIWIQIWGLLIQYISKEVGMKIGNKVGLVDDVSIPITGSKDGRFVRVRVVMDISKPLKRGCMVKLSSATPLWVEFRYERLPSFCCYCGLVSHDTHSCDKRFFDMENDELKDSQYGAWIRASPATQPGRKRSSSPQADRHQPEGSKMASSENLASKRESQANISMRNSGDNGDEVRNAELAHEEMVAESTIRGSRLPSFSKTISKDITPAQKNALTVWTAKNPFNPHTISEAHLDKLSVNTITQPITHLHDPTQSQPIQSCQKPTQNDPSPNPTKQTSGPSLIKSQPITQNKALSPPKPHILTPEFHNPKSPTLIVPTSSPQLHTAFHRPPASHTLTSEIQPNPEIPATISDLNLVDAPITAAPAGISIANRQDAGTGMVVGAGKRTYQRKPKGNVSTDFAKGKSVHSSVKNGKRKIDALNLEVTNDSNSAPAIEGQCAKKNRISASADNISTAPSKGMVEVTSHKWSPMDQ
ncbi:hypothetical protein Vadar_026778 [Vaccinium darrowii]|uniref:Uncharacterized protein n=1 Tax=Vaccinium darrowii TaxID=229202 RepID=A0ACB7X478_9ERIC|nr:hypothetical protein Vadar_026778 [Vaccinium darrowii]